MTEQTDILTQLDLEIMRLEANVAELIKGTRELEKRVKGEREELWTA